MWMSMSGEESVPKKGTSGPECCALRATKRRATPAAHHQRHPQAAYLLFVHDLRRILSSPSLPAYPYMPASLPPSPDGSTLLPPSDDRARLEQFEAILDRITDAFIVADAEGNLLSMNPAALRLHGFDTLEAAQQHYSDYANTFVLHTLGGEPIGLDEWPISRVLRGERFEGYDVQVHRTDSGAIWAGSYSGTPISDSEGRVERAVLTIRDITDRVRAEQEAHHASEALTRRVAELDAIITSIPDAVYVGTEAGIEWANADALTQLGFTNVRDLNRHIAELGEQIQTRDLETGERIRPDEEVFARALRGEQSVREVVVRHLQTGEDRIVRSAAAPIRVGGKVTGAVAVNTDVTKRVQSVRALHEANERLQAALRSRDEVLAVVSHDLRGLLSTVLLGATILRRGDGAGEPAHLVERAARRMSDLIEDLLDAARLEGGRPLPITPAPMELTGLLRELADLYAPQMEDRGLDFACDLPDAELRLSGDPKRLHQVVSNLLGNAAKFTPRGGAVSLTARADGGWARVEVRDTGTGILSDDLEHIFAPYWQEVRAEERQGAGLGLAIARELARRHGGDLTVASERGEGAAFTLTLPLLAS
jgi:PAS domain S-box-containing protein